MDVMKNAGKLVDARMDALHKKVNAEHLRQGGLLSQEAWHDHATRCRLCREGPWKSFVNNVDNTEGK